MKTRTVEAEKAGGFRDTGHRENAPTSIETTDWQLDVKNFAEVQQVRREFTENLKVCLL